MGAVNDEVLIELGLSQNEAKTYLTLLETGPTTIGKIANQSKIHRTNVYDAVKKLVGRGLISTVIVKDEKVYQASDPEHLTHIIKEKELRLMNILPQLALSHKMSKEQSQVCIYEGVKAAKNAMEHMLTLRQPIYVFGVSHKAPALAGPFLTNFHKRRVEQKVDFWHIYNADCGERARFLKAMGHTYVRYLPKDYDVPVATNVCGDEIWLILWDEDAVVIQIKNQRIAHAYKKYFDLLWNLAKEFD